MRSLPFSRKALAVLVTSVSMSAQAAFEPAGVEVAGGWTLIPTVGLTEVWDDNIYATEAAQVESFITIVSPQLALVAEDKANTYAVVYSADAGFYSESSGDNYTDQSLRGDAHVEAGSRLRFDLGAGFSRLHDPRGTGATEGNPNAVSEPDQYDQTRVDGLVSFGADEAKGRIELDAALTDREYVNNRALTSARDRTNTDVGLTFFYRVAPKTSMLFNLQTTQIDYAETGFLDSTEIGTYVGATWEATGKTTGTFKVGSQKKSFDEPGTKDGSGLSWMAGVQWEPTALDKVDIQSSRRADETDNLGSYIDSTSLSVDWKHQWKERLSSNLRFAPATRDYQDDNRSDDIFSFNASVTYEFDRWLEFTAGAGWSERDSNTAGYDYTRTSVVLGLNAAL